MKIFCGMLVIFGLYYVGELTSATLSLSLPGSLVGTVLLSVLLQLHVIELEQTATVFDFLLGHLSFLFLSAGVALMTNFPTMKGLWVWMLVICPVTTIITMGCSGRVVQHVMERKPKL